MATPSPAQGTGCGWVSSYEVQEDRAVVMTCHDPGHPGEPVRIRVLRIELDTMLLNASADRPARPKTKARTKP